MNTISTSPLLKCYFWFCFSGIMANESFDIVNEDHYFNKSIVENAISKHKDDISAPFKILDFNVEVKKILPATGAPSKEGKVYIHRLFGFKPSLNNVYRKIKHFRIAYLIFKCVNCATRQNIKESGNSLIC